MADEMAAVAPCGALSSSFSGTDNCTCDDFTTNVGVMRTMKTRDKVLLIQSLQEERRELVGKINRLRLFLDSPHPHDEFEAYTGSIDINQMEWVMEEQYRGMMQYKAALSERIGMLKNSFKGFSEGEN